MYFHLPSLFLLFYYHTHFSSTDQWSEQVSFIPILFRFFSLVTFHYQNLSFSFYIFQWHLSTYINTWQTWTNMSQLCYQHFSKIMIPKVHAHICSTKSWLFFYLFYLFFLLSIWNNNVSSCKAFAEMTSLKNVKPCSNFTALWQINY